MSDLAFNYIGQTGDLASPGKFVTGEAAIEQNVRIRLRFLEGSWFLDEALGIPYIDTILIKNPDMLLVESIFRQAVESTTGIQSVETMDLSLDATRKLTVSFTATMDTGQALVFSPFVIQV